MVDCLDPNPLAELDRQLNAHAAVEGKVVGFGFYLDHVLDGSHDLRVGARFARKKVKPQYRGLIRLGGIRDDTVELCRRWVEGKAVEFGVEITLLDTPSYRMPWPPPGPEQPIGEALEWRLAYALENMPSDRRFVALDGWIFDKGTSDPREPNHEAVVTCGAVFETPDGARDYAHLLGMSWPEHYERDVAAALKRFARSVAQKYGIRTSSLISPQSRSPSSAE